MIIDLKVSCGQCGFLSQIDGLLATGRIRDMLVTLYSKRVEFTCPSCGKLTTYMVDIRDLTSHILVKTLASGVELVEVDGHQRIRVDNILLNSATKVLYLDVKYVVYETNKHVVDVYDREKQQIVLQFMSFGQQQFLNMISGKADVALLQSQSDEYFLVDRDLNILKTFTKNSKVYRTKNRVVEFALEDIVIYDIYSLDVVSVVPAYF